MFSLVVVLEELEMVDWIDGMDGSSLDASEGLSVAVEGEICVVEIGFVGCMSTWLEMEGTIVGT